MVFTRKIAACYRDIAGLLKPGRSFSTTICSGIERVLPMMQEAGLTRVSCASATGTRRSPSGTASALSDSDHYYEPQSFSRLSGRLTAAKMLRGRGASLVDCRP
jgi:hypothetical protein